MIKHKFLTLDAIRGVAAIFVFMQHAPFLFGGLVFEYAYLAVDLFFVMSGFVIAHSYEQQMLSKKISATDFFKIRFIRLYPLYVLSILISIIYTSQHSIRHNEVINASDFVIQILCGLLLIPSSTSSNFPFPLNIPAWSIFFEAIVNVFYAFFYKCLKTNLLIFVILFGGGLLIFYTLQNQTINLGWNWANLSGGFPRVLFSFCAGLMIHRIRKKLVFKQVNDNLLSLLIISISILFLAISFKLDRVVHELIAVLIAFPILILLATYVNPIPHSRLDKVYVLLGTASYGLYILQFTFQSAFAAIFAKEGNGTILTGVIALSILVYCSLLIDRYYDQPVRSWMKRNILNK